MHVPFCVRKCPYCDFASTTRLARKAQWVAALETEARAASPLPGPADTLYLGGGTPSLLSAGELERVLAAVGGAFELLPGAEITLEANPGTVDAAALRRFRRLGVNRINLGVQSFQPDQLKFLGRVHSAGDARRAVESARSAGFDNLGIDLIYGLPGQDRRRWRRDLAAAAERADHISCYLLTLAPGTRMAEDARRGRFQPSSERLLADLYTATAAFLAARGFSQYEISNFARGPGRRSRHNMKYWTFAAYRGLGPAAHSYRHPVRQWNVSGLAEYLRRLDRGRSPVAESERLTAAQQMIESFYVGLRLTAGLDLLAFRRRFGEDFHHRFGEAATAMQAEGLLDVDRRRCALTLKGQLLHNRVVERFVDRIELEG